MTNDSDSGVASVTKKREKTKTPRLYKVVMLNDDYTTMDFVVATLESIFQKTPAEAIQIMLQIHKAGRGIAGVYSKQIAETKVSLVHQKAQDEGYPLRCITEED